MHPQYESRKKLIPLKNAAVEGFTADNWLELGILTGCDDIVRRHTRLFKSLDFGDPDYPGNALQILSSMVDRSEGNLQIIDEYISARFDAGGTNVSSVSAPGRKIYFTPSVFTVPDVDPSLDLVSAMMPFSGPFTPVYEAIKRAASDRFMPCERADDIWQHSAVIQDIFGLIYRSFVIVCDFSGKNPNVFYEAGIAHTLGKHVIPITQNETDIPFDLQHHRYIKYLNNGEGLQDLQTKLSERFAYLRSEADKIRR